MSNMRKALGIICMRKKALFWKTANKKKGKITFCSHVSFPLPVSRTSSTIPAASDQMEALGHPVAIATLGVSLPRSSGKESAKCRGSSSGGRARVVSRPFSAVPSRTGSAMHSRVSSTPPEVPFFLLLRGLSSHRLAYVC